MSLLARLEKKKAQTQEQKQPEYVAEPRPVDPLRLLKAKIHENLVSEVDPKLIQHAQDSSSAKQELRERIGQVVQAVLEQEQPNLNRTERQKILGEITDEVLGYGPIDCLIRDPEIS